jgi:CHAD domain-containing protein
MNGEFPVELAGHLAGGVKTLRQRYRKRLARCQEKFSETSVHELRIETRRMLAMLDLLRALHFEDSLKKTRKIFKRRLDTFDELRDTQVQLLWLKPVWRDFPEAREFDLVLRRREKRLIGELRKEIKRMKQIRLERRLKAVEKQLRKSACAKSARDSSALASGALQESFRHAAELRQRVRRSHTETIHRLRVSFKRFRYMSELLQPFFPRLTAKRLREMQAYQGLMGDIQDMEVLIAAIRQAVQLALLPAHDARGLLKDLKHRRVALIDKFMQAADRLFEFQPDKFDQKTEP